MKMKLGANRYCSFRKQRQRRRNALKDEHVQIHSTPLTTPDSGQASVEKHKRAVKPFPVYGNNLHGKKKVQSSHKTGKTGTH